MRDFEDIKKEINEFLPRQGRLQDETIMGILYNLANFEDKSDKSKINNNSYKNASNEKLFSDFKKDVFNNLSDEKLRDIFQELHNRVVIDSGTNPRYVVTLKGIDDETMGLMDPYSNNLEINKDFIEKKKNPNNKETGYAAGFNADNVGVMFALTAMHESRHTCQYTNILRYFLHDFQDKSEKGRACLSMMKLATQEAAGGNFDFETLWNINDNYLYDFDEQDANMYPVKVLKDQYSKGNIKGDEYVNACHRWLEETIGYVVTDKTDVNKIYAKRLEKMEEFINKLVEGYKNNIDDCFLKGLIMNIVNDYIKVDENGNSLFRDDMKKDFELCSEVFFHKDKFKSKQDKKEQAPQM